MTVQRYNSLTGYNSLTFTAALSAIRCLWFLKKKSQLGFLYGFISAYSKTVLIQS